MVSFEDLVRRKRKKKEKKKSLHFKFQNFNRTTLTRKIYITIYFFSFFPNVHYKNREENLFYHISSCVFIISPLLFTLWVSRFYVYPEISTITILWNRQSTTPHSYSQWMTTWSTADNGVLSYLMLSLEPRIEGLRGVGDDSSFWWYPEDTVYHLLLLASLE